VIADELTLQNIGATTPLIDQTDLRRDDPEVRDGFESFAKIAVILVDLMRWSTESRQPDTTAKICESLYTHLSACSTLQVPAVNDSIETPFRAIEFGKAATPQPGQSFDHRSANITVHPAPHPLLVIARSINTWLSFLFRNRNLEEYPSLKEMRVDECHHNAHSCILFPSCSDVCETPGCTLCFATSVLKNQSYFALRAGDCDLLREIEQGSEGGDVLQRIKPNFLTAEDDSCMCQAADDSKPGGGPAGIPLDPSSPGAAMSSKSSPDSSPD
jgi:hypothetical protein